MVTVISRFRVANGLRAEVEEAFKHRPRLVDNAKGFRGFQVHSDVCDPNVFYLYTVWDELDSFQRWHKSPAHLESHRGIPKGLRLDPSFTQIQVLYESANQDTDLTWEFVTKFLSASRSSYLIELDEVRVVCRCSDSFAEAVQLRGDQIQGRTFVSLLVEDDAATFAESLTSEQPTLDFICNVVPTNLSPFTMRYRVLRLGDRVLILGERLVDDENATLLQFVELNTELVRLTRAAQQQSRELSIAKQELAAAMAEREESYWFVRRLHEVLPICMGCHKVRPEESWRDLVEFLSQNTTFLSHAYCPECLEKWKKGEI